MDVETIDQTYQQLQSQAQSTAGEIQALGAKLQAAAQAGDQNAREWLLDLRSVALAFQAEQGQVNNLLQALHGFLASQAQAYPPQPYPAQQPPQNFQQWGAPTQQPMPQPYPQQSMGGGGMGGAIGSFLTSGFARSIESGVGFGIGSDLINKLL